MRLLDAIVWEQIDEDNSKAIGYKDVRDDEFWVLDTSPIGRSIPAC